MGVLRCDQPDIEEFIFAKQNTNSLTSFNLSIAITDEFMEAVQADQSFELKFEGRVYREVRAANLWETIMRSTWDWAEPGVIFIDRINEQNNLGYCEVIAACNPCSEQSLPPFGACLLGSFNLAQYLRQAKGLALSTERWRFDWEAFKAHIPVVVRAMDNVVDCALYPLQEQRIEALATRRMGLGIMGLANCIEAIGMPYGHDDFVVMTEEVLQTLKNCAYSASADLAKEKGSFPLFLKDAYTARPFIQGLEPSVQAKIEDFGLRNSHLISMAPTGTISFCMDNVSSGIEPVFAAQTRRQVRGLGEVEVVDYGVSRFGVTPKCADEVSAMEHIAVLCAAQRHTDSAVSKTCNVASQMPWEDFKGLYFAAWKGGAKGCATFQNGGKREGVMSPSMAKPLTECASGQCKGG